MLAAAEDELCHYLEYQRKQQPKPQEADEAEIILDDDAPPDVVAACRMP